MDLIKHNSSHLHNINFTNRLTISSVVSGKSRIAIFTLNQHGDKYSINHFKKNITNWSCKSESWTSCNTHWLSFRPFPSGSSAHTWPSLRKSEKKDITVALFYRLVIVLTRAAPALQYHFLLFFFFLVGLVVYSCVIFLLCCYGIAAQYFGFSNFGSQNTTSVQNVVLRSAWDVFFLL